MVPFGPSYKLSDLPLLPYERQLIAFLGITEAEYRQYRKGLINSGKPRPAEYELIPDVQAAPAAPFLIQIAIGLVLTGIGILLAPKPKEPTQEEDKRQSVRLSDQTGRSRFNSVAGFDGAQQIASLGAAIPIQFGKYEQHTQNGQTYFTGGFMASPQLVWSRMFSYGTHQGFKGLFNLGECLNDPAVYIEGQNDPTKPDDAGIQVGTQPLDALPDQQQAVYWNTNLTNARPQAVDLVYGTRGYPAAGDPQTNNDIFTCPTSVADNQPAFCMSYAPSGDTQFGFYSPIANGNGYMLNFKIIPIPSRPGDDDPGERLNMERRKISGREDQSTQDGTGRGYGPQMGIKSLNGWEPQATESYVNVNVGDEIVFWIRRDCLTINNIDLAEGQETVTANDVNNAINNRRAAADDALQIGETFMIGRTIWQVEGRNDAPDGSGLAVWQAEQVSDDGKTGLGDGQDVFVTLKMIETTTGPDSTSIGLPGFDTLTSFVTWDGGDPPPKWVGTSFWTLGRASLAVIRNVRPAEVTEFGIKSQVWGRVSGLCNFADIPSPETVDEFQDEGSSITNGNMTLYYQRTSAFTIWFRPVSDTGANQDWHPLGDQFCVTNNAPVDVYNFIRVTDMNGPRQLEFRFIPKNSADILKNSSPGAEYKRLDSKKGVYQEAQYDTYYGPVRIGFVGDTVRWDDENPTTTIQYNPEFRTSGEQGSGGGSTPTKVPNAVRIDNTIPESGNSYGEFAPDAYACELLNGKAPDDYQFQTFDVTRQIDRDGGGELTLKFTYTSVFSNNFEYSDLFAQEYRWQLDSLEVVGSEGDWDLGEVVSDVLSADNLYSDTINSFGEDEDDPWEYGYEFAVAGLQDPETLPPEPDRSRRFGGKTQVNEYTQYQEQENSCSNGAEHSIVYVNETVTPPSIPTYSFTSLGLAFRSSNSFNRLEQVRVWIGDGVRVRRWEDNTYGPSNLFSNLVYYLLTDPVAGLGSWSNQSSWTDTSTFTAAAKYLKANDIYFDGTIEDKTNLRSYLTEVAPLNLCNFVIANGQFSIIPALPFNPSSFEIDPDALPIKEIFSAGNIVDGSYSLDYLDASERQNFKAVMVYRTGQKNKVPQSDSVMITWSDATDDGDPQTTFDLTNFCSNGEQAKMIGRYLMSIRRRITHGIKFQTTPLGLDLAPGDYIKVITTDAPDSVFTIGAISPDTGELLSATEVADGSHEVTVYLPNAADIQEMTIDVVNNCVTDPSLFGALFTTLVPKETQNVYLIEQLDLDETGLVNVTASHFPTGDNTGSSIIALDTIDAPYNDGAPRFTYIN